MPNGSGRELADELERLQPGVNVLFMSGYTDDVIVQHFAHDEDRHFIHKPFSPEHLAAKVRMVLGQ
jgi:FixJ family two-component response regulator